MEKIFIDGNDKYVGAYVVFGDANSKLWADADGTVELTAADVVHAFKIGTLMINDGTNLLVPVGCVAADGEFTTLDYSGETLAVVTWTLGESA